MRTGKVEKTRGGRYLVPVAVRTRTFGTLNGSIVLPMVRKGDDGRVRWRPFLRLPGLRPGESVKRKILSRPHRAAILAADGRRLDRLTGIGALVGTAPGGDSPGSGLQRRYDERLGGRPGAELRFGHRLIRRVKVRRGHTVRATIRPGLQRVAVQALGNRLGGVAVLRPRDGSVLALRASPSRARSRRARRSRSSRCPRRCRTGSPSRRARIRSGPRPGSRACCCATRATSRAAGRCRQRSPSRATRSSPRSERSSARSRLVAAAERFGFNEHAAIPIAKAPRISQPSALRDSLAVGAAAIGQDRDLATPLAMASVGATIAEKGVRAKPRIVRSDPVIRHRAVRAYVAAQVRTMMIGVVQGGTGTAARISGVQVAGKTGTAELRPTAGGPPDPKNTDAWFVAFAPAGNPRYAVAVMLVGAGAGGAAAAPIARRVLQAALSG